MFRVPETLTLRLLYIVPQFAILTVFESEKLLYLPKKCFVEMLFYFIFFLLGLKFLRDTYF